MVWARMLAYITGTVDQELLLRNEYLAAENRILKVQIKGRLLLSDGEKATLSEIAYRLGRKALREVAMVAQPETILAWYRRLIAHKFDGSKSRRRPGRPRVRADIESLVVRMAKENPSWGYDRIVGALANLGHQVSDQTVGNILRRHGTAPAPQRKNSVCWKDFIRTHLDVMAATDFFTAETLPGRARSPTTCCSSSTWRRAGSVYRESRGIRTKSGWNSRPGRSPWRSGDFWPNTSIYCGIEMRNSAPRSGS
jgi:putative transposase